MGINLSRASPGVSSFYLTLGSFAPSGTSFFESLFPSRTTTDRQLNIVPWKRLIKRSLEGLERESESPLMRDQDLERERLNSVILDKILDGKIKLKKCYRY